MATKTAAEFAAATKEAVNEVHASATRSFESTISSLKGGMNEATAGFERSQAKFREQMEKALGTAEEFVTFQQGNLDAVVKAGQVWAAGVQDITKQVAASAQAQFDETVSTWKTLASLRSFKDVLDVQTNYTRSSVEKAVSESSRLADASFKLAEQAFAPIGARVSVAVEKFAKPF